jgi:hypothetical protein
MNEVPNRFGCRLRPQFSTFLLHSSLKMSYLLPCSCGQSVEIETSQAGQQVSCSCGATLQVPSMLQIKSLPIAVHAANQGKLKESAVDTGVPRKAFLIIGIASLVPATLFLLWTLAWAPQPFHVLLKRQYYSFGSERKMLYQNSMPITGSDYRILMTIPEEIDQMYPMELVFYFQTLGDKPTFSYEFQDNYQAVKERHYIWLTVGIIWIVLSVLCIVGSFFMPRRAVIVTGWSGSDWR